VSLTTLAGTNNDDGDGEMTEQGIVVSIILVVVLVALATAVTTIDVNVSLSRAEKAYSCT